MSIRPNEIVYRFGLYFRTTGESLHEIETASVFLSADVGDHSPTLRRNIDDRPNRTPTIDACSNGHVYHDSNLKRSLTLVYWDGGIAAGMRAKNPETEPR